MKRLIREFFFLRNSERRALVGVMTLLLLAIGFKIWVTNRTIPSANIDEDFKNEMIRIQRQLAFEKENENSQAKEKQEISTPKLQKKSDDLVSPFIFNPNVISIDSLSLMNLPVFVRNNLISYRKAGGEFKKKEDLLKIYGMDHELYSFIAPFVVIPSLPEKKPRFKKPAFDSIEFINLNNSDSLILLSIPGIGPTYAGRIHKYMKLLGGYYTFDQLWEVYGMDSIRFSALRKYTFIDTLLVRKIPLNTASFTEIIKHPYINKTETYAILQYREYVKRIKSISEIDIQHIIDHNRFIRLKPYLTIINNKE